MKRRKPLSSVRLPARRADSADEAKQHIPMAESSVTKRGVQGSVKPLGATVLVTVFLYVLSDLSLFWRTLIH